MSIHVRPVLPHEHEAVARLTLLAYDALGDVTDSYRVVMADVAGRIDDETQVLVAVEDDEVLGSVTVASAASDEFEHGPHGDGGFRMLAVAPQAQGRGVGGLLVEAALRHARDAGWRRIAITSMEWMPLAHGMYGRRGFDRRPDLDVRFGAGVGCGFTLDLVEGAADAFPPIGPTPDVVPDFVPYERNSGC